MPEQDIIDFDLDLDFEMLTSPGDDLERYDAVAPSAWYSAGSSCWSCSKTCSGKSCNQACSKSWVKCAY